MADLQLSPSMQPAACSEPEIPWSGWMPHDACALLLKVPEELLSKICPSGRAVMLFATSKRVRERLAQTQPLWLQASVRVVSSARIDSVMYRLHRMLEWCQVVRRERESACEWGPRAAGHRPAARCSSAAAPPLQVVAGASQHHGQSSQAHRSCICLSISPQTPSPSPCALTVRRERL